MKIGVRAHDYGRMGMQELAACLKREGLDAAQVAPPKAFSQVESIDALTEGQAEEIGEVFREAGIEISVLGCYVDLGNPDPDVRKEAVRLLKRSLSLAGRMGARLVGTETAYRRLSEAEKKEWFPYMLDSIQRATEEAARVGAVLGIEPVRY